MDKEVDVARAWKDEEYRKSLTPEQLATLPPNPAGEEALGEEELDDVSGGIFFGNSGIHKCCSAETVNRA